MYFVGFTRFSCLPLTYEGSEATIPIMGLRFIFVRGCYEYAIKNMGFYLMYRVQPMSEL